jgi:MFS family permease
MILVREGRASFVYRLAFGLWAALSLGAAAFFPLMRGILALVCYFFVRGLAEGLYWAARHRAFLWSVRDSGRDRFALRLQSLVVSLSVVLPLLGGFAITYLGPSIGAASGSGGLPSGYVPVFLFTGLVMLAALACSPSLEIGRSPVSFRAAFRIFRLEEARSWRAYIAFIGFAGGLVTIAAGVQTFGVLKTEFNIGALNAGIAALSGLFFFVLGKYLAGRRGVRTTGVLVGAVADFTSRAVYALAPTTGGLALKSVLDALAVPLKSLLGENVQFALIERLARAERTGVGRVSVAEL